MEQPTQPETPRQGMAAARARYRAANGATKVATWLIVAVLVLVPCCACAAIAAAIGSRTSVAHAPTATATGAQAFPARPPSPTPAPTATTGPTATASKPTPTPKSTAAATPAGQVLAGDTLGGTAPAFDQRYGPANNSTETGYTSSLGGGQADITLDVQPGQDGGGHVDIVGLTPSGGTTWAESGVATIVAPFLPPDARHTQDVQTDYGVEHEYVSRDLAATFPASLFTNDSGTQQVPPGTFFWQCPPASNPSLAATCMVSVGV